MSTTGLQPQIRSYVASDGYELRYRHWPAANETPRGYIVALHGVQSHSGWYEFSSGRIAEAGFELMFLDRRGSGLNSAERGHAMHADRLVNDVTQFLSAVRHQRGSDGPPIVLLSVSWGGKLSCVTAAARPDLIDALALLYPGVHTLIRPRPNQRAALRLAQSSGMHMKLAKIPLDDPSLFTSDATWQEFIRNDPLALHHATVSFMNASIELDRRATAAPKRIRCPLLAMLAGRDRIVDNAAMRRYVTEVASCERTLIEYRDAAHTLEFESNREQIFTALVDWLNRLPGVPSA